MALEKGLIPGEATDHVTGYAVRKRNERRGEHRGAASNQRLKLTGVAILGFRISTFCRRPGSSALAFGHQRHSGVPSWRGDLVYRIYGVHEGRAKDYFFGAFRPPAEAEAEIAKLRAQEMNG